MVMGYNIWADYIDYMIWA